MTVLKRNDISVTGSVLSGLLSIFVLLGGLVFWSVNAQVSGAVVAMGRVEIEHNRQVVQASIAGVVDRIAVQNGSRVQQGMGVMQLDARQFLSELKLADTEYFEGLAQRGRVQATLADASEITFDPELLKQANNNPYVHAAMIHQQAIWRAEHATENRTKALSKTQLDQIAAQIAGIKARKRSLREQRDLIRADLADQQALFDRGLATAKSLRAMQLELSRLAGALGDNDATILRAHARLREIDKQSAQRHAERLEKAYHLQAELRQRQQALTQHRQTLKNQIAQMTIRAPVSGVIHNLRVQSSRAVVRSAEPLMDVIPDGSPLRIAAEVAPEYAGVIRLNQPVKLRLSGISQRSAPELSGRVSHISADVVEDRRGDSNYLQVDITLTPQELFRLDPEVQIRLGMPVEVFMTLEPRRPISFLVAPMADYFRRAFRES